MEHTVADIPLSLKFFRIHDAEIRIEPFIGAKSSYKWQFFLFVSAFFYLPIIKVMIATTNRDITVDIQTSLLKGSRKDNKLGGACLGFM